jgi:2-polyprenyl-3-methyl-5-hydroxy-6-metoxy-1,4-benzoquinol methylase
MGASHESTGVWDRHWGAYEESAALNPAQAYRRRLILHALALEQTRNPVRLLEIGCGSGDLSREIEVRHPYAELVGIDASELSVETSRKKAPKATFFRQDLSEPLVLPERYRRWATHAVCSEVLEHLDDPATALKNVRACLAPGARVIITVPSGPMSAFDRHIGHIRHFTHASLSRLLADAGFEIETVHGAGFPFFNLYRLLVVLRGKRLVGDAAADNVLPASARAAMSAFAWLFRFNRTTGRRGWQLVAVAVEPDAG